MDAEAPLDIVNIAQQLTEAIKTTLNPGVSFEQRQLAYEMLEKIKDNSNYAIPCGFHLSTCDKEPEVRHLGLQLLEDCIRYHWNDLTDQEKLSIKNNSMHLLAKGTQDILVEQMYVKDKVSRLVVEIMKREWPQQWPKLLEELEILAVSGPTQAELVLLIFMRIAEDVATLQILESIQRRRDLYQALNQNMDSIFRFFFNLLEKHYAMYIENMSEAAISNQHCRVIQVIFQTLTSFVEWVSIHCINNNQTNLFNCLCKLISDQNIRQHAANCFLQVVSRKRCPEERKHLLVLYSENVMNSFFSAANLAFMDPLNESNYLFIKTLTQVVAALGLQLCGLWGVESAIEPQSFTGYLNSLLAFTQHPSLIIYSYTNLIWAQFFRHEYISKSKAMADVISIWLQTAYKKITKHGSPSKQDSLTCQYSCLEFDCDAEYFNFFCKIRAETLESIKLATQLYPELFYAHTEEWLLKCLRYSPAFESGSGLGSNNSIIQIEWDAVAYVTEPVMTKLSQIKDFNPPVEKMKLLLRHLLDYQSSDPAIISYLLTCISGLCVFLPLFPEVLQDVLNRVFSSITFNIPGQNKGTRSKSVKNTRKHSCSLLIKLCKSHPTILLNAFEYLNNTVNALTEGAGDISQLEKVTLIQALLVLNNNINNYEMQHAYIGKIIYPVKDKWLSARDVLLSPRSFMSFVGLDKPPVEPSDTDINGQNRCMLFHCVDIFFAVMVRSVPPADRKLAEDGGFLLCETEDGPAYRNPYFPHIIALLPNIFCFFRTYNGLYMPESLALLSEGYAKAYDLLELDKVCLLGLDNLRTDPVEIDVPKVQRPIDRMQSFLKILHEQMCHILGNAGPVLGREFYQLPHLGECIITSILNNVNLVSDYKLRNIIRIFLKPFIQACPKDFHESVILPVVHHFCPIMMNHLQSRWNQVSPVAETNNEDDEATDTQEMLDNIILHLTTREYLEMIKILIIAKPNLGSEIVIDDNKMEVMDEMEGVTSDSKPLTQQHETLSSLGKLVLRCDAVCQSIVLALMRVLTWSDSYSCQKAIRPLLLCVQEMIEEGQQHLNEEGVKQIWISALSGIHVHGQHAADLPALIDLAIALYEKLSPHFPILKQILLELPGANPKEMEMFEQRINSQSLHPFRKSSKNDKKKREIFKQIIYNVIGKNIGEAFKKKVQFQELQPMFRERRPKQPRLDECINDLNLCSLFDPSIAEYD